MKDKAYDGMFCNSDFVKCPYALNVKEEWFCGFYHETLMKVGGFHKLARDSRCIKDEEKKRTYQGST
jgi:hypothetical protein